MRIIPFPIYRLLKAYREGPYHPFKLRFFNSAWKFFGFPKVVVPYLKTASLCIDPFEHVGRTILETGYFEPEIWRVVSLFVQDQEVFWDVGAHYGNNSIAAALNPRVKAVHSFECSPYMLEVLQYNCSLNGGIFVVHPFGISSKSSKNVAFKTSYLDSSKAGLESSLYEHNQSIFKTITVPVMSIDDVVEQKVAPLPSLIKMDIEGHEYEALLGASKTLETGAIKAIVFESKQDGTGRLKNRNFLSLLSRHGFKTVHIVRQEMGPNENYLAYRGTIPEADGPAIQFNEA